LLNGDGATIDPMYTVTEVDTEDARLLDAAIPANPTLNQLLLHVNAGTPAANVTSRYYRCGIHFLPPQP